MNIYQESFTKSFQEAATQPARNPVPELNEVLDYVLTETLRILRDINDPEHLNVANEQMSKEMLLKNLISKRYPDMEASIMSDYIARIINNDENCLSDAIYRVVPATASAKKSKISSARNALYRRYFSKTPKEINKQILNGKEEIVSDKVDEIVVADFAQEAKDNLTSNFNELANKFAAEGKASVDDLKEDVYDKPERIADALAQSLTDWEITEKVLIRFTVYGTDNFSYQQKIQVKELFKKDLDNHRKEQDKKESEHRESIRTEFTEYYNKKRTEAKEDPDKDLLNDETYLKAKEAYEKAQQDESLMKAFDFASINPKLSWMDETFVDPEFIGASEIRDNKAEWLGMVMSIETNAYNTNVSEKKNTPEDEWNRICDEFNNMISAYEALMEKDEVKNLCKENKAFHRTMRNMGASISYLGKSMGIVAYIFGAYIPGGTLISEPLSWLAKHTNRVGRLIDDRGSTLEDKKRRKQEKEAEKAEEKDKERTVVKTDKEADLSD